MVNRFEYPHCVPELVLSIGFLPHLFPQDVVDLENRIENDLKRVKPGDALQELIEDLSGGYSHPCRQEFVDLVIDVMLDPATRDPEGGRRILLDPNHQLHEHAVGYYLFKDGNPDLQTLAAHAMQNLRHLARPFHEQAELVLIKNNPNQIEAVSAEGPQNPLFSRVVRVALERPDLKSKAIDAASASEEGSCLAIAIEAITQDPNEIRRILKNPNHYLFVEVALDCMGGLTQIHNPELKQLAVEKALASGDPKLRERAPRVQEESHLETPDGVLTILQDSHHQLFAEAV
ncbi:MAG: hypothetical protein LBD15_02730 [Holosporales bacterium]|jgi:hypothetical protein|nr:hypothetical protein [Holosporales bacterium]